MQNTVGRGLKCSRQESPKESTRKLIAGKQLTLCGAREKERGEGEISIWKGALIMERGGEAKEITYRNKGVLPGRSTAYVIQEYYGRNAVNEYLGYGSGDYLTLYPRKRLYPSPLEIRKHNVHVRDIERDY